MTEEILKAADTRVEPARPLRVIHVEDFESAAPLSDGMAQSAVKPPITVEFAEFEFVFADRHYAQHPRTSFTR